MIQVCDLSFANSSITDTLGNYSLVSSGTVTISGVTYPTNTDPILYVTDSSYSCIEFGQTATYSNGAIIQAGIPDYGSENWAVEFRARVTVAMPEYYENCEIFYGCRAPYDDNGTLRMGGHWSISINYDLNALEFGYVDHYDTLTIKDNLDFTAWHLYKVTKTAEEILTLHIDGVLVATIDLEQQIGYKTRATLGSFALLGDVDGFPTANRIHTNQVVRLADVKVYADPMGHAEKAISLDNLSRVFRNYNTWLGAQLSGQIGDGTLTIQKNGTNVATFTANQSTAATANITVPTAVSELTNDSGYLTASSNLDASKLTSGTVDIARLPQGALERLIKVANEAARYALTTADVQLGDTVQQLDTGIMYIVTDADHLDSAAGYTEYTAGTAASVPWSGVTGKPTFAAVATSGAYSDLTGTPALAAVATSGAYSDLTGTPTIPTVNDATLTIQRNGVNVQTFTANQSTNATANITVPTKTSDLTNDSGFITEDTTKIPLAGSNAISGSLIPATDNSIDIGSSTKNIKMLYTKGITIDGTQFLPSDYVPRSGGAVLTGSLSPSVDSAYDLGDTSHFFNYGYFQSLARIENGLRVIYNSTRVMDVSRYATPASNLYAQYILHKDKDGENLVIFQYGYETDRTSRFQLSISSLVSGNSDLILNYRAYADGSKSIESQSSGDVKLGSGSHLFGQIYSTNATISTSDERQKDNIKQIDDKLLDAWEDVDLVQFNFKDALEKKGDNARLHTGYIAQNIQQACEKNGVNPNDYGLFCYDSWEEQEEKKDENGQVIEPYRAKGDLYSLRYEEALVVECKYLRRCIARLTARIEELEKGKEQEASK